MSDRRHFLRGLATLPLIGGSVALIGRPTAAAVPVTEELMHSYKGWLRNEHYMLCHELAGYDAQAAKGMHKGFYASPGLDWHFDWPGRKALAGWPDAPQPSTRAAIVLSAVGCSLTGENAHG